MVSGVILQQYPESHVVELILPDPTEQEEDWLLQQVELEEE